MKYSLFISTQIILSIMVAYTYGSYLTLEEALNEAFENNPAIQASKSQVDAASARIAPSYIWPDPSFEVMWMNIPGGSLDPSEAGMRQYAVSQRIPFPGKQLLMGSQMSAMEDMIAARSDAQINNVLVQTEYAYWNTYRLSRNKEILEESLVLLEQLLASARSRYATGAAPQAEVIQAQLARSEVDVNLISLGEMLYASRVELALSMGRDNDNLPRLPKEIPIEFASIHDSIDTSPMVMAGQANVRLANRKNTSAWLDALPDFMAAYRWRVEEGEMGSSDIMLGVSLPIYVWPRTSSQITAADAERKAAVYNEQGVRNQVLTMYTKLTAKLTSSRKEIERIQSEVLPLAQQSLASARIAYETGAVEFNTLLTAEKSWRSARMSLEEARFHYQTSLADLRALVGGYEVNEE